MLTLVEQDDGKRVTARVGDEVVLRLPENASTGYRWAPDGYDAALLDLAEESASYAGAVGSGGEAVFRFRVKAAGSGLLRMKVWRHWEGESSVIKRFAVTIEARP